MKSFSIALLSSAPFKYFINTLTFLVVFSSASAQYSADYSHYHKAIIEAETCIADKNFEEALEVYGQLFRQYEFVFLRDYQIATQLAWYTGNQDQAFEYLRLGVQNGWEMRHIKRLKVLKAMQKAAEWKHFEKAYDALHRTFVARLDLETKEEVRKMYLDDQAMALKGLFRWTKKGQKKFAEQKFAPKNEKQVEGLLKMIQTKGYPGEQIIGEPDWASTILAHHNSVSPEYCSKKSLYPQLRPLLLEEVSKGTMAPFDFALIDNWFITVKSDHQKRSYGFLDDLTKDELQEANQLRTTIGLRSVATRNKLLDLQELTGIDFFLPPWPGKDRKIGVADETGGKL